MIRFYDSLREHSINKRAYENAIICYIYKEKFRNKYLEDKKYREVRDHCHYTGQYRCAAHSICYLNHSVPKKIPVGFHKGFKRYYHFIIKVLV